MKKSQPPLLVALAVLLLLLLPNRSAFAQVTAHDDAGLYNAAGNTWTNGENLGFGFQPWVLQQTGTGNGNFTGYYIGNGDGISTANGSSFGIYANGSSGGNMAAAFRGFSNSLSSNQVFRLQWHNNGIGFSSGNQGGFVLRNGNSANSPGDVETGARFDFYYIGGGSDSYVIADGNGANYIGLPFGASPFSTEFTLVDADDYRFVVKDPSGANILFSATGPLAGTTGGTIDSVACYAKQTGGDQNFNNFEITSTSLVPPAIVNVQPTNNSVFLDPTATQISFEVDSTFSTVTVSNVTLKLNGVTQSGLQANTTAATTQLLITNTSALAVNTLYNATITALDANGNRVTNTFSFNTWISNLFFVEAEDYNYNAGSFINNSINPSPDQYAGLNGTNGVDFFKPSPGDGGTNKYRLGDAVDLDSPPISADVDHNDFGSNGAIDYNLSFVQSGEWENYSRVFNGTTYNVYARMASLSANPTMELERLATIGKATTTNQPLAAMGTFVCPPNTGGGQSYIFVPLKDFFSNPVTIRPGGTNTFRSTRIGGGYNFNYLIFVPSINDDTLRPYISAGFPYPSASAGPETLISFTIANRQTAVNPATIQLFFNSNNVTAGISLSNNAAGTVVRYMPPSFLTPNSTNTLTAIFADNDSIPTSVTNTWTFTVGNVTILTLPGTNAQPFNSGTPPGITIHITKASDDSPDADFPNTLARAEAQLAGRITNANTGQPYPNLAIGGPDNNGNFSETSGINFDINAQSTGTIPGDVAFPYIPASPRNDLIAMEALMFLQLTNGNYAFVVRSDDGFKLTCGSTPAETNFVIGLFDGGRDNSTPTTMYFTVTNSGLYPMRLLYFQGRLGGSVEFYSLNRAQNNTPILINDLLNPSAVQSWQNVTGALPLTLLNPAHHGTTNTFSFQTQYGKFHYVEYKTALTTPSWTPLVTINGDGSTTNVTDATATNAMRFYRVRTQ